MQPTASKTDLLLKCQRPFDPNVKKDPEDPDKDTEPQRYGSCVHALLERRMSPDGRAGTDEEDCAKYGIDSHEAITHANRIEVCLRDWMKPEGNPLGLSFEVHNAELTSALDVETGAVRPVDFEPVEHTYDLQPGEIGGAYDLLLKSGDVRVIVDLKTGDHGDWLEPESLGQLKTLVAMAWGSERYDSSLDFYAAIVHAPRNGLVITYLSEFISRPDVVAHIHNLQRAFNRIGDGSLTPGSHCPRCPTKLSCPAYEGQTMARTAALVKLGNEALSTDVDLGKLHLFLTEFDRLAKLAREKLRDEVRNGAIIERPDGKVLELCTEEFETLSKASILRKLGKEEGERLIEELRERGVIEESSRETLRARRP